MPRPGPSVTSGADLQPGSDSLFPSGFTGGGARPSAGSVGTGELADGSVAAADLNLSSVATALAARSEFSGTYASVIGLTGTGIDTTGTTDSVTALNALLATAGGKVARGVPGASYLISAPLVVPSGATLDMSGCTVALATGANCNMLQNAAVTAVRSVADAAITSGAATLTSATAAFTSADTGRTAVIAGAGGSGNGPLVATMTYVNATTVTLSVNAQATVSSAALSVYSRDSYVRVVGGYWNRGAVGGAGVAQHSFLLRHLDGVTVRGIRSNSTSAKYFVSLGDVTNFTVEDCDLVSFSDGVHVNGPAYRGVIKNLRGTTGDDMVALTGGDYAAYQDTAGDIRRVTIEDIQPISSKSAVGLVAGQGWIVDEVTCRRLRGATTTSSIAFGSDTGSAGTTGGTFGTLTFEDIELGAASGAGVQMNNPAATRIIFDGVRWSPTAGTPQGFNLTGSATSAVEELVIRDAVFGGTVSQFFNVNAANTTITTLRFEDCRYKPAVGSTSFLAAFSAGALGDVTLRDCSYTATTTTSTYTCYVGGTASVAKLRILGGTYNTVGSALSRTEATVGTFAVHAVGARIVSCKRLADLANDMTFVLQGLAIESLAQQAFSTTASGSGTIIRADQCATSGTFNLLTRSASQTVRVVGTGLPTDLALMSKTNGDICYNANAALTPVSGTAAGLVGPCVCDGTNWKNIFSGSTY